MVWAGRTKLRVSKNFFPGISFCICRISLQTQPQNQNKKYQKLYFNFSYCKPPELAGWFTPPLRTKSKQCLPWQLAWKKNQKIRTQTKFRNKTSNSYKFIRDIAMASERKFPGGTKVDTGPPNLLGLPSIIGANAVKSFFVGLVYINFI